MIMEILSDLFFLSVFRFCRELKFDFCLQFSDIHLQFNSERDRTHLDRHINLNIFGVFDAD